MNVKHKTRAHINFFSLAILFSFYFCAFRSRLRASVVLLPLLLCEHTSMYWRFAIGLCLRRHQLWRYGQYTFVHSLQRYTPSVVRKAFRSRFFLSFFPRSLRCRSTRLCLYLGHPMRTVLFLVLDRPAISQLTYQQQQQPANNVYGSILYRLCTLYTRTHFSRRAFATMSDEP